MLDGKPWGPWRLPLADPASATDLLAHPPEAHRMLGKNTVLMVQTDLYTSSFGNREDWRRKKKR